MWDIAAAIGATLVSCTILIGIGVRYTLIPYLQKQLIDPIVGQLAQVITTANDAMRQADIVVKAWDHHQSWSQMEVDRIWRELRTQKRAIGKHGASKEW